MRFSTVIQEKLKLEEELERQIRNEKISQRKAVEAENLITIN